MRNALLKSRLKADDSGKLLDEVTDALTPVYLTGASIARDAVTEELARDASDFVAKAEGDLLSYGFSYSDEVAAQAAEQHAARLVTFTDRGTRRAISRIIADAQRNGVPPAEIAKSVEAIIGMDERSARRWARLVDNSVEEGMSRAEARRLHASYADKARRTRSVTIARTETMRAANEGQTISWRAASDAGLLEEGEWMREWVTTVDERACDICRPLDGQRAPLLDGGFGASEGGFTDMRTPPAHPRCRCTMTLVKMSPEDVNTMTRISFARRIADAGWFATKNVALYKTGLESQRFFIRGWTRRVAQIRRRAALDYLQDSVLVRRAKNIPQIADTAKWARGSAVNRALSPADRDWLLLQEIDTDIRYIAARASQTKVTSISDEFLEQVLRVELSASEHFPMVVSSIARTASTGVPKDVVVAAHKGEGIADDMLTGMTRVTIEFVRGSPVIEAWTVLPAAVAAEALASPTFFTPSLVLLQEPVDLDEGEVAVRLTGRVGRADMLNTDFRGNGVVYGQYVPDESGGLVEEAPPVVAVQSHEIAHAPMDVVRAVLTPAGTRAAAIAAVIGEVVPHVAIATTAAAIALGSVFHRATKDDTHIRFATEHDPEALTFFNARATPRDIIAVEEDDGTFRLVTPEDDTPVDSDEVPALTERIVALAELIRRGYDRGRRHGWEHDFQEVKREFERVRDDIDKLRTLAHNHKGSATTNFGSYPARDMVFFDTLDGVVDNERMRIWYDAIRALPENMRLRDATQPLVRGLSSRPQLPDAGARFILAPEGFSWGRTSPVMGTAFTLRVPDGAPGLPMDLVVPGSHSSEDEILVAGVFEVVSKTGHDAVLKYIGQPLRSDNAHVLDTVDPELVPTSSPERLRELFTDEEGRYSLTMAQSVEAAEAALQAFGVNASLRGLDGAVAGEVMRAVLRVNEAGEHVKAVEAVDTISIGGSGDTAFASYNSVLKRLRVSRAYLADPQKFFAAAGDGYFVHTSVEGLITHETGHALFESLTDEQKQHVRNVTAALGNPDISGYAGANEDEYYAEAVAAAVLNAGSEAARSVGAAVIAFATGSPMPDTPVWVWGTDTSKFDVVEMGSGLGGMHNEKVLFRTPDGALWLYKVQLEYRAQADVVASNVYRRAGVFTPLAHMLHIPEWADQFGRGLTGSVQRWLQPEQLGPDIPLRGMNQPGATERLSPVEGFHIQKIAVLEWLLSQNDGHDRNYARRGDNRGLPVVPIDLGQAFKFYGRDRLDEEYNPNPSRTMFHALVRDYVAGRDVPLYVYHGGSNAQTKDLFAFIKSVRDMDEDEFTGMIRPYVEAFYAHRDSSHAKQLYPDVEAFLDAVVERKDGLRDAFRDFYDNVKARRTAPPPQLPDLTGPQRRLSLQAEEALLDYFITGAVIVNTPRVGFGGDVVTDAPEETGPLPATLPLSLYNAFSLTRIIEAVTQNPALLFMSHDLAEDIASFIVVHEHITGKRLNEEQALHEIKKHVYGKPSKAMLQKIRPLLEASLTPKALLKAHIAFTVGPYSALVHDMSRWTDVVGQAVEHITTDFDFTLTVSEAEAKGGYELFLPEDIEDKDLPLGTVYYMELVHAFAEGAQASLSKAPPALHPLLVKWNELEDGFEPTTEEITTALAYPAMAFLQGIGSLGGEQARKQQVAVYVVMKEVHDAWDPFEMKLDWSKLHKDLKYALEPPVGVTDMQELISKVTTYTGSKFDTKSFVAHMGNQSWADFNASFALLHGKQAQKHKDVQALNNLMDPAWAHDILDSTLDAAMRDNPELRSLALEDLLPVLGKHVHMGKLEALPALISMFIETGADVGMSMVTIDDVVKHAEDTIGGSVDIDLTPAVEAEHATGISEMHLFFNDKPTLMTLLMDAVTGGQLLGSGHENPVRLLLVMDNPAHSVPEASVHPVWDDEAFDFTAPDDGLAAWLRTKDTEYAEAAAAVFRAQAAALKASAPQDILAVLMLHPVITKDTLEMALAGHEPAWLDIRASVTESLPWGEQQMEVVDMVALAGAALQSPPVLLEGVEPGHATFGTVEEQDIPRRAAAFKQYVDGMTAASRKLLYKAVAAGTDEDTVFLEEVADAFNKLVADPGESHVQPGTMSTFLGVRDENAFAALEETKSSAVQALDAPTWAPASYMARAFIGMSMKAKIKDMFLDSGFMSPKEFAEVFPHEYASFVRATLRFIDGMTPGAYVNMVNNLAHIAGELINELWFLDAMQHSGYVEGSQVIDLLMHLRLNSHMYGFYEFILPEHVELFLEAESDSGSYGTLHAKLMREVWSPGVPLTQMLTDAQAAALAQLAGVAPFDEHLERAEKELIVGDRAAASAQAALAGYMHRFLGLEETIATEASRQVLLESPLVDTVLSGLEFSVPENVFTEETYGYFTSLERFVEARDALGDRVVWVPELQGLRGDTAIDIIYNLMLSAPVEVVTSSQSISQVANKVIVPLAYVNASSAANAAVAEERFSSFMEFVEAHEAARHLADLDLVDKIAHNYKMLDLADAHEIEFDGVSAMEMALAREKKLGIRTVDVHKLDKRALITALRARVVPWPIITKMARRWHLEVEKFSHQDIFDMFSGGVHLTALRQVVGRGTLRAALSARRPHSALNAVFKKDTSYILDSLVVAEPVYLIRSSSYVVMSTMMAEVLESLGTQSYIDEVHALAEEAVSNSMGIAQDGEASSPEVEALVFEKLLHLMNPDTVYEHDGVHPGIAHILDNMDRSKRLLMLSRIASGHRYSEVPWAETYLWDMGKAADVASYLISIMEMVDTPEEVAWVALQTKSLVTWEFTPKRPDVPDGMFPKLHLLAKAVEALTSTDTWKEMGLDIVMPEQLRAVVESPAGTGVPVAGLNWALGDSSISTAEAVAKLPDDLQVVIGTLRHYADLGIMPLKTVVPAETYGLVALEDATLWQVTSTLRSLLIDGAGGWMQTIGDKEQLIQRLFDLVMEHQDVAGLFTAPFEQAFINTVGFQYPATDTDGNGHVAQEVIDALATVSYVDGIKGRTALPGKLHNVVWALADFHKSVPVGLTAEMVEEINSKSSQQLEAEAAAIPGWPVSAAAQDFKKKAYQSWLSKYNNGEFITGVAAVEAPVDPAPGEDPVTAAVTAYVSQHGIKEFLTWAMASWDDLGGDDWALAPQIDQVGVVGLVANHLVIPTIVQQAAVTSGVTGAMSEYGLNKLFMPDWMTNIIKSKLLKHITAHKFTGDMRGTWIAPAWTGYAEWLVALTKKIQADPSIIEDLQPVVGLALSSTPLETPYDQVWKKMLENKWVPTVQLHEKLNTAFGLSGSVQTIAEQIVGLFSLPGDADYEMIADEVGTAHWVKKDQWNEMPQALIDNINLAGGLDVALKHPEFITALHDNKIAAVLNGLVVHNESIEDLEDLIEPWVSLTFGLVNFRYLIAKSVAEKLGVPFNEEPHEFYGFTVAEWVVNNIDPGLVAALKDTLQPGSLLAQEFAELEEEAAEPPPSADLLKAALLKAYVITDPSAIYAALKAHAVALAELEEAHDDLDELLNGPPMWQDAVGGQAWAALSVEETAIVTEILHTGGTAKDFTKWYMPSPAHVKEYQDSGHDLNGLIIDGGPFDIVDDEVASLAISRIQKFVGNYTSWTGIEIDAMDTAVFILQAALDQAQGQVTTIRVLAQSGVFASLEDTLAAGEMTLEDAHKVANAVHDGDFTYEDLLAGDAEGAAEHLDLSFIPDSSVIGDLIYSAGVVLGTQGVDELYAMVPGDWDAVDLGEMEGVQHIGVHRDTRGDLWLVKDEEPEAFHIELRSQLGIYPFKWKLHPEGTLAIGWVDGVKALGDGVKKYIPGVPHHVRPDPEHDDMVVERLRRITLGNAYDLQISMLLDMLFRDTDGHMWNFVVDEDGAVHRIDFGFAKHHVTTQNDLWLLPETMMSQPHILAASGHELAPFTVAMDYLREVLHEVLDVDDLTADMIVDMAGGMVADAGAEQAYDDAGWLAWYVAETPEPKLTGGQVQLLADWVGMAGLPTRDQVIAAVRAEFPAAVPGWVPSPRDVIGVEHPGTHVDEDGVEWLVKEDTLHGLHPFEERALPDGTVALKWEDRVVTLLSFNAAAVMRGLSFDNIADLLVSALLHGTDGNLNNFVLRDRRLWRIDGGVPAELLAMTGKPLPPLEPLVDRARELGIVTDEAVAAVRAEVEGAGGLFNGEMSELEFLLRYTRSASSPKLTARQKRLLAEWVGVDPLSTVEHVVAVVRAELPAAVPEGWEPDSGVDPVGAFHLGVVRDPDGTRWLLKESEPEATHVRWRTALGIYPFEWKVMPEDSLLIKWSDKVFTLKAWRPRAWAWAQHLWESGDITQEQYLATDPLRDLLDAAPDDLLHDLQTSLLMDFLFNDTDGHLNNYVVADGWVWRIDFGKADTHAGSREVAQIRDELPEAMIACRHELDDWDDVLARIEAVTGPLFDDDAQRHARMRSFRWAWSKHTE